MCLMCLMTVFDVSGVFDAFDLKPTVSDRSKFDLHTLSVHATIRFSPLLGFRSGRF